MEEPKEKCVEYVIDGAIYDTHEWEEVFTTSKIQSLKCKLCGMRDTAKFSDDYKPPKS